MNKSSICLFIASSRLGVALMTLLAYYWLGFEKLSPEPDQLIFALMLYVLVASLVLLLRHKNRLAWIGLELGADGLMWLVLLNYSGGIHNPLTTVWLLVLFSGAMVLAHRKLLFLYVWLSGLYTWLMIQGLPVASSHFHHGMALNDFHGHLIGMWLQFIVLGAFISVLIVQLKNRILISEQRLNEIEHKYREDEQLLNIAVFAAQAAHDLATPTSTLKLLIEETQAEDWHEAKHTLQIQMDKIENHIHLMRKFAQQRNGDTCHTISLSQWIQQEVTGLTLIYPHIEFQQQGDPQLVMTIRISQTLALRALLDNAFKNAKHRVRFIWKKSDTFLTLIIEHDGQWQTQSESDGWGLGHKLANVAIMRYGGELRMDNMDKQRDQCTEVITTQVRLPQIEAPL